MTKKSIVWFEEVGKEDVGLVGGKGANLGEMSTANMPIPYGFIVTSNAYFEFIKHANIEGKLRQLLSMVNYDNPTEIEQASEHIRDVILKSEMPPHLNKQIIDYYTLLNEKEEEYLQKKHHNLLHKALHKIKNVYSTPLVAVRSSATAEDLPDASFAGQQDTYLNIHGETYLLQKIKECYASLFTTRAIYYRHEKKFYHFKVGLAAVVQRMVQSEKSGIAFSIDPVTNDKTKIVIEAVFGLGEYIVQGKVTPDHYEVDKNTLVLTKKQTAYQNVKFIRVGQTNEEVPLHKKDGSLQKLTENEIIEVALLVKSIENHYYFPQDIEWALEKGRVFIVQSRPITTTQNKKLTEKVNTETKNAPIVVGAPASPGIGVGPANIVMSPREISKVKHGDVLVAPQTNPDYVPAMKKASAIVTDKGGRTSHAAIVSRELGIPAVVGTENATKVIKDEMVVSINGTTGEVFKGSIIKRGVEQGIVQKVETNHHVKTLTHVYVNLAEPEKAQEIAKLDSDGVGLLRAEFMIAEIGTHPLEFIKQGKQSVFIHKLARDLETNEYRHLKGGALYEPEEENPMLGFRGASRYIADPEVFMLELDALQTIWDRGYNNMHLMIPFVRVP